MIRSGNQFEEIVEMLNRFREEVRTKSSLGLTNINVHAQNFVRRILNLTYKYELDNLNRKTSNYAGLDLGDSGEGVAYQLTSTKKGEKIDETLRACINHERYKLYPKINVFILTAKQSSYSLKTVTDPYFSFSAENNIQDFDDLYKDIQDADPIAIRSLYDYIKMELGPVIASLDRDDIEDKKFHLNLDLAMAQSRMPKYYIFQAIISIRSAKLSVPKIFSGLKTFLSKLNSKNYYFPAFNELYRMPGSHEQIIYVQNLEGTGLTNVFRGQVLAIETSQITLEKAEYGNNDLFLTTLEKEIVSLLTCILLFKKESRAGFQLDVSIRLEANNQVYLSGQNSLIVDGLLSNFVLMSPYSFTESITDVDSSTLAELLQFIVHGFIADKSDRFSQGPYIDIEPEKAKRSIDKLKTELGYSDFGVI